MKLGAFGKEWAVIVAFAVWATGCGTLLGLGDFKDQDGGTAEGGSGSGGSSVSTSSTSTSGVGGMGAGGDQTNSATSSGGQGGTGGGSSSVGSGGAGGGAPSATWSLILGDQADQRAAAVAVDSMGNVYVAGTFAGTMTLPGLAPLISSGAADFYLLKLNQFGTPIWAQRYGDAASDPVYNRADKLVAAPNGSIALLAHFKGSVQVGNKTLTSQGSPDTLVAKFDESGTPQWSFEVPASAASLADIAIDPASADVIAVGALASTVDLGSGPITSSGSNDVLYSRLAAASGVAIWAKKAGNWGFQSGDSVGVDPSSNIVIAGHFSGSLQIGAPALTSNATSLNFDFFLARTDANGSGSVDVAFPYNHSFGSVRSVATDALGDVRLVGNAGSAGLNLGGGPLGAGLFIGKFSSTLVHQWSKAFAGKSVRGAINPVSTGLELTGSFAGTTDFGGGALSSAGGFDAFIASFGSNGAHLQSAMFGAGGNEVGSDIAADNNGYRVIVGSAESTIDFGSGQLMPAGGTDAFVARLAP